MSKEEFLSRKKAIQEQHDELLKLLYKEFALENNPVNVGDVIKDHYKFIRVEKFTLCSSIHNTPMLKYRGTRLTAKGEPYKRETDDNTIYQSNITEINGNPYEFEE